MAGNLTPEQVEAILVHELAHIRRKDFLLNLGVTMLEGLFFFNPFTRWLIADLKKEREFCCDDLVLQFRYDPHTYVSALLAVARQASQTRQARLVVAATGGGGNQLLLQRAKLILQQQRTADRSGARPFALLFLTLLVTLATLSRPARSLPAAPVAANPVKQPRATGTEELRAAPIISNATPTPRLASNAAPTPPVNPTMHSARQAHPPKQDMVTYAEPD